MTRVRRVFLLIDGLRKTMQHRLLILALGLAVVAASWFALQSVAAWRLRSELRLAARDFAARRISDAKARLTQLVKRWPGRGEVEYWLGVCEMEEGHPDAAMAAWERVPDDAAEAPRAHCRAAWLLSRPAVMAWLSLVLTESNRRRTKSATKPVGCWDG
jgi:Tetratricopeptide repeat